jgi:hypothetical protein
MKTLHDDADAQPAQKQPNLALWIFGAVVFAILLTTIWMEIIRVVGTVLA